MRVFSVSSQKGGTAKTTTAAAVAAGAAMRGYKALCIDLDPQGSLTYIMGADGDAEGSYQLIKGSGAAVQHCNGVDVIPASLDLAGIDMELSTKAGRDFILREALEPIKKDYDIIVLDTAPQLGTLLINALTASTEVIIPVQADVFALQGIYQLLDTIRQVQKFTNKELKIAGVLLTRYTSRTVISRDLTESIQAKCDSFNIPLLKTAIREGVAIKEAQLMRQSIYDYAADSNATKDYIALLNELEIREGTA